MENRRIPARAMRDAGPQPEPVRGKETDLTVPVKRLKRQERDFIITNRLQLICVIMSTKHIVLLCRLRVPIYSKNTPYKQIRKNKSRINILYCKCI